MARELQDLGFAVGRRRIALLMRENGMHARQKRRFRKTTDSHHAFRVAPNIIGRILPQQVLIKNGMLASRIFGRDRDGCILRSSLTSSHAVSSDGPSMIACIVAWLFELSKRLEQCGDRQWA
ncbi:hypothetical protein KXR64_02970 [Brucella intermedia]